MNPTLAMRGTLLRSPDGSDYEPPPIPGGNSRGGARPPSKPSHPDVDGAELRHAIEVQPPRPRPVTAGSGKIAARKVSAQKSDAELIAEAVAAGRVTKCPAGIAHGTESTAAERVFGSRMPAVDFRYGSGESKKKQQVRAAQAARTARSIRSRQTGGTRRKKFGA